MNIVTGLLKNSDTSLAGKLRPGMVVRVVELKCSTELNGLLGTCNHFDASTSRWCVHISDIDAKKMLKTDNLQQVEPESLQAAPEAKHSRMLEHDDESSTGESCSEDDTVDAAADSPTVGLEDLKTLPLLEEVAAPRELIEEIGHELAALRRLHKVTQELQRCEEAKEVYSRIKEAKAVVNACEQELQLLQQRVAAKAESHYRHQSILWHPDRAGDSGRERFDKLRRGVVILVDPILRQLYMDEMVQMQLTFAQLGSTHELLKTSHESFMARSSSRRQAYVNAAKELARNKAAQSRSMNHELPNNSKTPQSCRLGEGGFGGTPPKPQFICWEATTHVAVIGLHTTDALSQRARQVELQLFRWGARHEVGKWETIILPAKDLCDSNGRACEAKVKLNVRCFGDFDLRWRLEYLSDDGCGAMHTSWSAQVSIDHLDPDFLQLLREGQEAFTQMARQQANLLEGSRRVERARVKGKLEEKAESLHRHLEHAIDTMTRLVDIVQKAGEEISRQPIRSGRYFDFADECASARNRLLKRARSNLQIVEAISTEKAKRRERCIFCNSVKEYLEQDTFQEWIVDSSGGSSSEALEKQGWDVNRIFQILVEWCKSKVAASKSLMVVASTYWAAASRSDIFTRRQCRILNELAREFEGKHVAAVAHAAEIDQKRAKAAVRKNLRQDAAAKQAVTVSAGPQQASQEQLANADELALTGEVLEHEEASEQQQVDIAEQAVAQEVGQRLAPTGEAAASDDRDGLNAKKMKLQSFMAGLGLAHHTATLDNEEMYLDVMATLGADELSSCLKELNLPMGARLKIVKACSAVVGGSDVEPTAGQPSAVSKSSSEFRCPITLEIMRDPVVCADGHTYEKSAIEAWLRQHSTSPVTNLPLPRRTLVANHALRSQIQRLSS